MHSGCVFEKKEIYLKKIIINNITSWKFQNGRRMPVPCASVREFNISDFDAICTF